MPIHRVGRQVVPLPANYLASEPALRPTSSTAKGSVVTEGIVLCDELAVANASECLNA